MKILGICGSIRKSSSNWAILNAAQKYFSNATWDILDLTALPYFDPDNQHSAATPEVVTEMRRLAKECDLIFISTPEYAHGIPGILKNGLEWLFCEHTSGKKVAVVIGSTQGEWARDQLFEVLKTMDFAAKAENFLILKGARTKIEASGTFTDSATLKQFEGFCEPLVL
jgi:NAD(P)H-dependent FMN reductase